MFTQKHPAENIFELLSFLENDSPGKYVYRGQTKHYGILIPSGFREFLIDNNGKEGRYYFDPKKLEQKNERSRRRIKELGRLISYFGKVLGNILAQQYGITSECIDVTESPKIAAFFATRKYPTYDHYPGEDNNRLGVIYRFKKYEMLATKNGIESALGDISFKEIMINGETVNSYFMSTYGRNELNEEDRDNLLLRREFVEDYCNTFSAMVTYQVTENIFAGFYNTNKMEDWFYNTRLVRQEGGLLIPSTTWLCLRPKEVNCIFKPEKNQYVFDPPYSIKQQIVALEDSLYNVEELFFKHSDQEITSYNRSYLWPDWNEDRFFKMISIAIYTNNEDYLNKHKVHITDINKGLIDAGYYDL